jgi:hypothetical protein
MPSKPGERVGFALVTADKVHHGARLVRYRAPRMRQTPVEYYRRFSAAYFTVSSHDSSTSGLLTVLVLVAFLLTISWIESKVVDSLPDVSMSLANCTLVVRTNVWQVRTAWKIRHTKKNDMIEINVATAEKINGQYSIPHQS